MSDQHGGPWSADRGRSFGSVADVYAASRPSYPVPAVRWVAAPGTRAVLDLGAGTGKLTRVLADAGYVVTAVEPLVEMLHELRVPGVRVVAGAAEHIPLRDGSVDAVYAGQAFHWFRTGEAVAEIARVLRPGGRLGLLWNMLDTRVRWVAELATVLHEQVPEIAGVGSARPFDSPLFPAMDHRRFAHPGQHLDLSRLLDLVRSRSYIVTLPADEHATALERVTRLVREHPDLRGHTTYRLPYVTEAWRATQQSGRAPASPR